MSVSTWSVAVIYILLVGFGVIAEDLRYAFVPAAVAVLAFCAGGLLVYRRFGGSFAVPWPASSSDERDVVITITGTGLPFLGYEQDLIISYKLRHLPELVAMCVLALETILVISRGLVSTASLIRVGFLPVEVLCMLAGVCVMISLRWLSERRFLPKSHVTVGEILSADPGFVHSRVTYQFFDDHHERRGGRGPFISGSADNAVLVFYDPSDPDRNLPQSAFRFHQFKLSLAPGRRNLS